MNRYNSTVGPLSLIVVCFSVSQLYSWVTFDDMENNFQAVHDSMEESFDQIRQQMHETFKHEMSSPWKIDYVDTVDGKMLTVAIMGVYTNDVKAQLSDDMLRMTVVTDSGTAHIKTAKNWISVTIKQNCESKKKSKKGSVHSASITSKSSAHTVTCDLDLANAKVGYSAKERMLSIMIPYNKDMKKGKVVPVVMDLYEEQEMAE